MSSPYRVAVLTVSDTAFHSGPEYDLSGPHLRNLIDSHPSYINGPNGIVPDEKAVIEGKVKQWVEAKGEDRVDWIITTGGTGWSPRDVTPEALLPYLKPLPILLHHLSSEFLAATPRSILSRPVVGLWDTEGGGGGGGPLVVCLPGSKKAVVEGWVALVQGPLKGVLEHGFNLLRGGSGSDVHPPRHTVKQGPILPNTAAVERDGSSEREVVGMVDGGHDCGRDHGHHAHHRHHSRREVGAGGGLSVDPSKSVSGRLRQSPFPMISLSTALSLVEQHSLPLSPITLPVNHLLRNHILAEDILATTDLPITGTTNVDGYAVNSTDIIAGQIYEVMRPTTPMPTLEKGKVYRINTGGPLPPGADSVIMVEDTELVSTIPGSSGGEKEIRILKNVKVGEEVRQPGSDAKVGEKVLTAGTVIGSGGGEIGLMGFVGKKEVSVYRRPIVAVLSTGNELVDLESSSASSSKAVPPGGWTGTVDTNRPSLRAAIEGFGYEVIDLGIAEDTMEKHLELVRKGLEVADVIVTTGGTSMGESDLLKPMLEHELGGTIHFGRVAMKPGKPTTFASIPSTIGPPKLVFALPGNPASALVTFHLFCLPALRGLGGWPVSRRNLPRIKVLLGNDMPLDPREEFHRVIVTPSADVNKAGLLVATSTGGQRSSRVASLCGANGFVHLPMREKEEGGREVMKKGELADAVMIGEIQL